MGYLCNIFFRGKGAGSFGQFNKYISERGTINWDYIENVEYVVRKVLGHKHEISTLLISNHISVF